MANNGDKNILPDEPEAEVITLSSDEDVAAEKEPKAENTSLCSVASTSLESTDSSSGDLHKAEGVFENFLALCSKCLEMPRDQPVVAKLRKVYSLMDIDYKVSSDFVKYLKNSMDIITPYNVYETLKPVLDHMKSNRLSRKREEGGVTSSKREPKREAQIARLEELLERLDKKIKEISEKEVNWDDDDDTSGYLLEDRLKRKFVRTYQLLCKLKQVAPVVSSKKRIVYSGTRYHEINQHISKLISKSKNAPDYHDIVTAVSEAAQKCRLELNEQECQRIAREAFPDIVTMIQKRRVQDFLVTFGTYQTDQLDADGSDPALTDEQLKEKLSRNLASAKTNLDQVFEKYERLQEEKNLTAGADDPGEEEEQEEEDDSHGETDENEESKDSSDVYDDGVSEANVTDEEVDDKETVQSVDTQTNHAAVNGHGIKAENGTGCKNPRPRSPPTDVKVEVKRLRTSSYTEIVILD